MEKTTVKRPVGRPRKRASDKIGAEREITPVTTPKHVGGKNFIQTVGRRKRAVARLRLHQHGSGTYIVNNKPHSVYFPYPFWQEVVSSPLPLVGLAGAVDITVKVEGGGLNAQSEAVRLALARALILVNADWRPTLRKMGWLTRDSRQKERKKPGLKRARRAPQWQKR